MDIKRNISRLQRSARFHKVLSSIPEVQNLGNCGLIKRRYERSSTASVLPIAHRHRIKPQLYKMVRDDLTQYLARLLAC